MKELKFKTSKGKFLIKEYDTFNDLVKDANFYKQKICKLSEITEEQANAIVDKVMNNQHFQNYDFKEITDRWTKSAIDSLRSLLKSKGVHLFENPYNIGTSKADYNKYKEAESKTFYNPYIFKIK